MTRLTINLDDDVLATLKETSARKGRTVPDLIDEILRENAADPRGKARALVAKARAAAAMDEAEALRVGVEETRRVRAQ